MRPIGFLTISVLFLFLSGCADEPTAPDLDITASYGKPDKPGKPPKPGDDPADPLVFTSIETSFHPIVGAFTCAIEDADDDGVGPVYCWGNNSHYSLGLGGKKKTDKNTPTAPAGGDGFLFSEVHLGNLFACGIEDPDGDGKGPVFCWGQNEHGELGDGTTKLRSSPTPIASSLEFFALDAGGSGACALAAPSGEIYCWGHALPGSSQGLTPTLVWEGTSFSDLSVGTWGTRCGINGSSEAVCWHGAPWDPATQAVVPGGHVFSDVVSGDGSTCGLTTTGRVFCWAVEGDGVETDPISPVEIDYGAAGGESGLSSISAGFCAIGNNTGKGYCWGRNDYGQVGDGSVSPALPYWVDSPVAVAAPGPFTQIGAKNSHGCAITSDGAYCWGSNDSGELGNGTTQDSPVPVKVAGQ